MSKSMSMTARRHGVNGDRYECGASDDNHQ
jgi:hypothetical protein